MGSAHMGHTSVSESDTSDTLKVAKKRKKNTYKCSKLEDELMEASKRGDLEAVLRIAASKQKLNIESEAPNGATALKKAASRGHTEVVRVLLEHFHADINNFGGKLTESTILHGSALFLAIKFDHFDTVRELLGRVECDINQKTNKYGNTSLMVAVRKGLPHLVGYLLMSSKPKWWNDAIHSAVNRQYLSDCFTFKRHSLVPNENDSSGIDEKADTSDIEHGTVTCVVKSPLSMGAKLRSRMPSIRLKKAKASDSYSSTSASKAYWSSRVFGAKSALAVSRDIDTECVESTFGASAVHMSGWHNPREVALRLLLTFGASANRYTFKSGDSKPTASGGQCDTPLHRALTGWMVSDESKPRKVETLLAFAANPFLKNHLGVLPLDKSRALGMGRELPQRIHCAMQDFSEKKPYLMFE